MIEKEQIFVPYVDPHAAVGIPIRTPRCKETCAPSTPHPTIDYVEELRCVVQGKIA